MAKECLHIGCSYSRFGGGFCKMHQYKREDKKPKPLSKTPIKKVSTKRSKENAQYLKARMKFLIDKTCPITGKPATEIHHKNGREHSRLIDESYWLAVTREGHQKIHANPQWARDNNYLI
jgi:hypothetical protein